jgi:hypothetical protein
MTTTTTLVKSESAAKTLKQAEPLMLKLKSGDTPHSGDWLYEISDCGQI